MGDTGGLGAEAITVCGALGFLFVLRMDSPGVTAKGFAGAIGFQAIRPQTSGQALTDTVLLPDT